MWNVDDPSQFIRVLQLDLPRAETWGEVVAGKRNVDKRERLRELASHKLTTQSGAIKWWAFRITVQKTTRRPFDVDNVLKTIIDAFCAGQIKKDRSSFTDLALYPDDSIDHVRLIQVYGERVQTADATKIEVFGFVGADGVRVQVTGVDRESGEAEEPPVPTVDLRTSQSEG